MKYLKFFENHTDYETYINGQDAILPNVSLCEDQNDVHYNPIPHDYSKDYFTIVSLADNNEIKLYNGLGENINLSYSLNNGETWTALQIPQWWNTGTIATLDTNEKVLLKGTNTAFCGEDYYHYEIRTDDEFSVEGNIMSLLYGDNFIGATTLQYAKTFCYMFQESNVISAENLVLPATTLTEDCYYGLFKNASRLEVAPKELPATTTVSYCYDGMFQGTSITRSPDIPNINSTVGLANMFYNCNNLAYIKCLAENPGTIDYWVRNVAATGTFVKHPNAQWNTGDNGIPSGWTVETASE